MLPPIKQPKHYLWTGYIVWAMAGICLLADSDYYAGILFLLGCIIFLQGRVHVVERRLDEAEERLRNR